MTNAIQAAALAGSLAATSFAEILAAAIGVEPMAMLLAAVTTLAGVVSVLWRNVIQTHASTIEKLNDCEDDRSDLWRAIAGVDGCDDPQQIKDRYKKAKGG